MSRSISGCGGKGCDAVVHMGAHGTLEWLPGKSVALSQTCWPEALTGDLPVIYPFIVNDPGEAAQAKRRIGAVTIGHLPPPLAASAVPDGLRRLEQLLDEYSTADGLDPARRQRLIAAIRDEARAAGLEDDLGLDAAAAPAEAIPRIDRFVCDLKESQFGDGLHVFGRGPCGDAERDALRAVLAGQRVAPGPSGSPYRGRQDVLPTGRNLFAVDPRAVPTPSAHAQGIKLAEELLRRHLQDHGDWPKGLVVDLWGSATMRTAGEEFAMALHLAGLAPRWDHASGRVTGYDIIAPAELGRPRIDVTLRVSGLFRDVFAGLAQLFEAASEALATREDEGDENPYRHRPRRACSRRAPDNTASACRPFRMPSRPRRANPPAKRGSRHRPGHSPRTARSSPIAPASNRGSHPPMLSCTCKICRKPIFCSRPTMPPMKPALRRPQRISARQDHRSIISTRRDPSNRMRVR
ncbi:cobalamin biosynthesis Mg chelatase CobN [Bradyrhizobium sp. LB7.2]